MSRFRFLLPPTEDVYTQLCKERNVQPAKVVLDDGTKAYRLGPSSAEILILNFHVPCNICGYVLPGNPEQFKFLWQLQSSMEKEGKNVAVLFLDYDLSPSVTYPRQLQQASAVLSYLVHNLRKHPSNIMLCGDSAGGNLAAALLSHLSHPHPQVPAVLMSSKLRGVGLISPQITFETKTASFNVNSSADLISAKTLSKWGASFIGGLLNDNYTDAIQAPAHWWNNLKVGEILVVVGNDELLLDSTQMFTSRLKEQHGNATQAVIYGEGHNSCNIDAGMGFGNGVMGATVQKWIQARV
ncbi:alpha/beta-hydrolase [Hyaloscypha variabilis F]|uniref:Alpha/beta-hydrolase n=1 Tax=Hyaloscypha variabilis (strain UAMH 11265 / GT02V1 / F) TaxID=1149755 RepID=A0A2J6S4L4_HYAVF|nr:alpha/beta-hydrolase [Hyaloscypha variabilis F]